MKQVQTLSWPYNKIRIILKKYQDNEQEIGGKSAWKRMLNIYKQPTNKNNVLLCLLPPLPRFLPENARCGVPNRTRIRMSVKQKK